MTSSNIGLPHHQILVYTSYIAFRWSSKPITTTSWTPTYLPSHIYQLKKTTVVFSYVNNTTKILYMYTLTIILLFIYYLNHTYKCNTHIFTHIYINPGMSIYTPIPPKKPDRNVKRTARRTANYQPTQRELT